MGKKEYLPGGNRERIADLMKEQKITQTQLAEYLGCSPSTISRYLKNEMDLDSEKITLMAQVFKTSTDFLLGLTGTPNRKNFDIEELGLSINAARNLYTGKVNQEVACALLENPRFTRLSYTIKQFLDDEIAQGIAAHNQLLATISNLLLRENPMGIGKESANEVTALNRPVFKYDLHTIKEEFEMVVKEVKKEVGTNLKPIKEKVGDIASDIYEGAVKGQDIPNLALDHEKVKELIVAQIVGVDEMKILNEENKKDVYKGIELIFGAFAKQLKEDA